MRFPEGYTRLEYIQSLGAQYIDTGFKPNQNTRVVMDAQLTVSGTSNGQFLFGARGASYKPAFAFFYSTDGPSFKYAYNATSTKGTSTNFTARLYVDADKNVCSFNGESITVAAGTFQSTISMYLFASNENGTTGYYTMMRLYSCRIYDNGNLVRDFIPCKNSSGVAGLYDFANGVFYDNDGTGTFTAGPEIVETLKIVDAAELDTAIGATADAIRAKTGKTDAIAWNAANGFASAVSSIAVSSRMQSKTVTPSTSAQTIEPDSGYDALSKVTVNAMPTATQATPSITVSSEGLITASATQPAGYVATGTKSATKQLTAQAAKTVTPGMSDQTAVASGVYTTGAITVKGDANLKAENIAKDVSIFGITGTHAGGGNVATGSVTVSKVGGSITVAGLGFKPANLILYFDIESVGTPNSGGTTMKGILNVDYIGRLLALQYGAYNVQLLIGADSTNYNQGYLFSNTKFEASLGYTRVTFTSQGFTVLSQSTSVGTYRYIATS